MGSTESEGDERGPRGRMMSHSKINCEGVNCRHRSYKETNLSVLSQPHGGFPEEDGLGKLTTKAARESRCNVIIMMLSLFECCYSSIRDCSEYPREHRLSEYVKTQILRGTWGGH